MRARQEKTFEDYVNGDYWQGRDTPQTRKTAASVLKRKQTEVHKRLQKKASLFMEQLLDQELRQLPTVDDLLARRRQIAATAVADWEEDDRKLRERIERYKTFVAENMGHDYLQDCMAREESWRSSSENFWYACYHKVWIRREKPIGERQQKLLKYIIEWQDVDFSACELFDCICLVEGRGVFQDVSSVRDSLNELAARAYIGLSCGRESKVVEGLRVIAWPTEYLDRSGVLQEVYG